MISLAKECDGWIEIYDENGNRTGTIITGGSPLVGFTATSVSVKGNGFIEIYDENGNRTGTIPD